MSCLDLHLHLHLADICNPIFLLFFSHSLPSFSFSFSLTTILFVLFFRTTIHWLVKFTILSLPLLDSLSLFIPSFFLLPGSVYMTHAVYTTCMQWWEKHWHQNNGARLKKTNSMKKIYASSERNESADRTIPYKISLFFEIFIYRALISSSSTFFQQSFYIILTFSLLVFLPIHLALCDRRSSECDYRSVSAKR